MDITTIVNFRIKKKLIKGRQYNVSTSYAIPFNELKWAGCSQHQCKQIFTICFYIKNLNEKAKVKPDFIFYHTYFINMQVNNKLVQ